MKLLSIIICTRDRSKSLASTLAAMDGVEIPEPLAAELIIVDNGSRDDTAQVARRAALRSMPVKYFFEPKPGKARALNLGMAEAAGDILVFSDDDVIPPRNWLAVVCAPILSGAADAVAGGVTLSPHLERLWMQTGKRPWLSGTTGGLDPSNPSRMLGANMAISRRVLERIPAFDIDLGPGALGFGEDTLLALQLRQAGYRLAGVFDSPVEHHFDEDRLAGRSRMENARKLGRVDAYLAHHWEHAVWPHPLASCLAASVRLALYMATNALCGRGEGNPSDRYLEALRAFHARIQYLREMRKPRNYEKLGLCRKEGQEVVDKSLR